MLLAKQLLKPANILVLDEPTNDLDMATLELLEESVASFGGTILLISHDRSFMDNVVTSTWVFDTDEDGKGTVSEYVGGYQEYLVQKNREEASKAAKSSGNTTANSKSAAKSAAVAKPNNTAKKLNFNDQRELDALPKEIAALEAEQTQLEDKLADGTWFNQDFDAATAASERLLAIEDEMMTKLERWNTLES